MADRMSALVGLDFGTSTTLIAHSDGIDGVSMIPLGATTRWLPSIAGVADRMGSILVAEETDQIPLTQIVRSIKKSITKKQRQISIELPDGPLLVDADAIASAIVAEAFHRVRSTSGFTQLSSVRAGCPAMWDADQRERLRGILQTAGFAVDKSDVIDEPIAAALSWVTEQRRIAGEKFEGLLVVFDYGGGTLDVAVCLVRWEAEQPKLAVLSCEGVDNAGDNIDDALAAYVEQRDFSDLRPLTEVQNAAIRRAVTGAKEVLSTATSADVVLDRYGLRNVKLTRAELETTLRPLLMHCFEYLSFALRGALLRDQRFDEHVRISAENLRAEVDCVLLTGGTSQIPLVQEEIQKRFGRVELVGANAKGTVRGPQEAVVAGLVYEPERYSQINLHRPSFDVWLEWKTRGRQPEHTVLYRAHTPLYGFEVFSHIKSTLGARGEAYLPDEDLEWSAISLRSVGGESLPIRLVWEQDGPEAIPPVEDLERLPLGARRASKVDIKLYVDGRILIRTNERQWSYRGHEGALYLETWPMIRTGLYKRSGVELSTTPRKTIRGPEHPDKY